MESAFQDRKNNPKHPSRHSNKWFYDNCKTEATNLQNDAKIKLENSNKNNQNNKDNKSKQQDTKYEGDKNN
jgi:hypothetical protein